MGIKPPSSSPSALQWSSYESIMAKFAVLVLAALAFQAASAGVHLKQRYAEKSLGDYEYGYGKGYGLQSHGYPTGKFDALFGQLQTVAQDLTLYSQKALPNDRLVIKTLIWQSRELAQYIDTVIERLQAEVKTYSGQVSIVLGQFISELREIQVQYQQIAGYTTDVYAVSELKNQFYSTVQRTVAQLEKLVRFVQTEVDQTKGDLYVIVKNLVSDFLYAFQNIYTHVQYYGVYGEQSPRQLVLQIEEVTKYLTGYLQGLTYIDAQRSYVIREYIQHVEAIISRFQEVEGTHGNIEIDTIFQQVYGKLRRVLVPFRQLIETENIENVEVVRVELIKELQYVVEALEQFVQYAKTGDYQTFFFEILGDYLYALQQLRIQLQGAYHGYYGFYQGFNGKNGYQGTYGKYQGEYQGPYNYEGLYGKTGYQGLYKYGGLNGKTGYQGLYKYGGLNGKTGYQGLYNYGGVYDNAGYQGAYKYGGLYGKTGYQGLYKYGGLYDKTGYGYFGKYQYAKYGQDLKQYEVQIQTIIRDLYQVLQTVNFDDATIRQSFIHLIREYTQQLEYIVERLHQYVSYTAGTEVYNFQQVAQNLKQYIFALQQFYTSEYSVVELRTQFYLYVQKVATEFERLVAGIEQTNGTYYNIVREILTQYLGVTYDLYYHFQSISEIAQYGYGPYARQYYGDYYGNYYGPKSYGDNYYGGKYYGKTDGGKYGQYYGQQGQVYETPRELVNQIQYIARDLSTYFQEGVYFTQQHAQILSVQAREFAEIIRYVIDRLEAYENADVVIQQVIYKLREVQVSLQQLASYNVLSNVHQFRAEFDNYIQIAVGQIEKLVLIAQEQTRGNFYYIIKDVLSYFLYGLHDIHYKIQEVFQYGQYGKGYGYAAKYGYGKGYGYGKYEQQYGYGKYGQGYGYGKYGQQYGFGKYGQQYGFGKYGQGYGYDKYAHGLLGFGQYGKGYGYGKIDNQYGSEYGLQGRQYYGLQYGYGVEGKTVEQLAFQIQTIATQVVDELQTVAVNDKQIRQFFFVQARQLIQIIDNIIDRFQIEYTYGNDNTVQQVISNLRQIRLQLQQIVNSGVITTVYQIKAQIANYFQEVAAELKQLALVAQTDLEYIKIVKNVLVQYIDYLHNVQYQLQYNVYGYQGYQTGYGYGYQGVPSGKYLGYSQYHQDAIRGY